MTQNLLQQLKEYEIRCPDEKPVVDRLTSFVLEKKNCFERTLLEGHVTGSGLVVDRNIKNVLLTHHAKLNRWLQFGGHSDGHPIVHETALRECQEESGIQELNLAENPPRILDVDIHEIPARKEEPLHLHYDICYLVISQRKDYSVSSESHDVKWFSFPEAMALTNEESLLRKLRKAELLSHF